MRYKETGVDSQTHTFGALLSASQTVWYILKLRVHSQNRLSEASRYFVAHFAHVWLRHNIRKRNIPLSGMFPFLYRRLANPHLRCSIVCFADGLLVNGARKTNGRLRSRLFFFCAYYILKIARASSSLPASWRRFSDETSRLFIVSLMPCAEFIVLVVEASFCSEIDARLCTTS